jgi:hypothetical protein
VSAEKFNPRALYVFGSYTIGKERLFLEVARSLGKKVYVCKDKMQVVSTRVQGRVQGRVRTRVQGRVQGQDAGG